MKFYCLISGLGLLVTYIYDVVLNPQSLLKIWGKKISKSYRVLHNPPPQQKYILICIFLVISIFPQFTVFEVWINFLDFNFTLHFSAKYVKFWGALALTADKNYTYFGIPSLPLSLPWTPDILEFEQFSDIAGSREPPSCIHYVINHYR